MAELEKVIYSIERCTCHVPDACRDCAYDAGHPYNECVELMLKDALALLKAQDAGWISVKDRLPDEQETYLVFRKEPYGMITISWYSGPENGWLALDGGFYADGVVTHWMPLPEPPKEAKE